MATVQDLLNKRCQPCAKGTPPLSSEQVQQYLTTLEGWVLVAGGKALRKEYTMKNFMGAVQFIDRIATVAEAEDHHPDLHLTGYRKLAIELATHSIGGLSENDFILAAKIDRLPKDLKG